MTDYECGVEQASAIYKEVIREYVAENAKLREERDRWHVEQVHAYGNWEDAHKRATELELENAKLREVVNDSRWHLMADEQPKDSIATYVIMGASAARCTSRSGSTIAKSSENASSSRTTAGASLSSTRSRRGSRCPSMGRSRWHANTAPRSCVTRSTCSRNAPICRATTSSAACTCASCPLMDVRPVDGGSFLRSARRIGTRT